MYYFCSIFHFKQNIVKHFIWGRVLAVYTNTARATSLTHPPTTKNVVLPRYVSSPQNYSTIGCSASINSIIRTAPLSNTTTTNKVYTDFVIDDESQYFETPRKTTTVTLN